MSTYGDVNVEIKAGRFGGMIPFRYSYSRSLEMYTHLYKIMQMDD